jgi:hypothetical protein
MIMKYYDSKGREVVDLEIDQADYDEVYLTAASYMPSDFEMFLAKVFGNWVWKYLPDGEVPEHELDYLQDKYYAELEMMAMDRAIMHAESYYEGDR